MKNSPCHGCGHRSQICHGSCQEYFDWVAEIKSQNNKARQNIEAVAYAVNNREKMKRRYNLR